VEKKKDVSSFAKSPVIGGLSQEPSLYDILCYSYCYVGIMTGKSLGGRLCSDICENVKAEPYFFLRVLAVNVHVLLLQLTCVLLHEF